MRACLVGYVDPGMIRKIIVFCLFILLTIAGISTTLAATRQHLIIARGWRDPATTPDLPVRQPLLGINVELTHYNVADLNTALDRMAAAGFVWLRQPFRWSEIGATKGSLDFSAYDRIVAAAAKHPSLRLVAVLDETPQWARHAGAEGSKFAPPASPSAFGEFAGQVAAHFGTAINTYQIWDEPNLNTHWGGLDPRPADYVAMLRSAYTAIHAANADAQVIAAALAPTSENGPRNLSDPAYLHAIYENGGKAYFDAAAAKPYGFDSSPLDRTVSVDVLNFSRITLLREEMERQHDGAKPLWGSNFGWNNLPNDWKNAPSIWGQVSADVQETYTRAAYARAAHEWPWIGGLILEHWSPAEPNDDPIQGFAIAGRLDSWLQHGALIPADESLSSGLHVPTDSRIKYDGQWRMGPLGADVQPNADGSDSRFTTTIIGDSVALSVRRADYVAYLYVTIDDQPANALPRNADGQAYLLLTSPDRQPHTDLITVARDLPPGQHKLSVRAYLGYDRWAIAGIAVGSPPDTHGADILIASGALLTLIGLAGVIFIGRGLPWARLAVWQPDALGYLRRMQSIILSIGVSILTMLGMFLTFGGALPDLFRREPPALLLTILTAGLIYFSPAFIVTIISIVVLFLIIFNRPALGLCLIVFWAPFFLTPVQIYLNVFPMVELCLILTALAIALRAMIGLPRLHVHLTGLDWAMLAFAGVAVLTVLWSEQRTPALRELRTMVLEPALFYLLLRVTPLARRDVLRLIDVLLAAGIVVCLIGLEQYVAGGSAVVTAEAGSRRLASVYGSPNNVALFLGRCIPFAFAMALFPLSGLRRVVAALVVVLMLLTVALTQSIGALLFGIPAALVVVLIVWDRRKGVIIAAGLAGLLGVGGVLLAKFVPRLQGVLDGSRESSFVRTRVWASALNLLREHPITGAGLDQFLYLYRSRYILPDAWREPDLSHPHNIFLDYWVSLGVAGLAILIALQGFFWLNIITAYRRARQSDVLIAALCAGAMGSMTDFLAHGLVDNSYFVIDLAFVFCLTAALSVWLRQNAS